MTMIRQKLKASIALAALLFFVGPALAKQSAKKTDAQATPSEEPASCPSCPECPVCPPAAPETLKKDLALLQALQSLMSEDPSIRLKAIEDLGNLNDKRAIEPLGHCLRSDKKEPVRSAAGRALGNYPEARAGEILSKALTNSKEWNLVRMSAADGLGNLENDDGFERLWSARGDEESTLGKKIRTVLAEKYAQRYEKRLAKQPIQDQSGRWFLVPTMAVHGGIFMTGLAQVAGGEPGIASVIGGATVGGLTPYLLTIDQDMPRAQAFWLDSTITWGLFSGGLTYVMFPAENDNAPIWYLLGGQTVGLTAGLMTYKDISYSSGDILYMNAAGVAGLLLAAAPLTMTEVEEPPVIGSTLQAGMWAGLITSGLWVQDMELTKGDALTIAGLTAYSTYFSNGINTLIEGDDTTEKNEATSIFLGASLGFVGSSILSQHIQPTTKDVYKSAIGTAWGGGMAYGLASMTSPRPSTRLRVGMTMTGATGGMVASTLMTDDTHYTYGDRFAVLLSMGWGGWQGLGFGARIYGTAGQAQGMGLVGFGLGALSGAYIAKNYQPTRLDIGMATSLGVWGGWLTGWSGYVANKNGAEISDENVYLATMLGADAGLATGTILLSSYFRISPIRLGWINAAGLLGMGIGTSFTAVFSDRVAEGNLVGSTIGLITGALITPLMDFDLPSHWKETQLREPSPSLFPEGLAWFPTATMQRDEEGRSFLQFGIAGIY